MLKSWNWLGRSASIVEERRVRRQVGDSTRLRGAIAFATNRPLTARGAPPRHFFEVAFRLMKLRILRFGSDEDRNVRVCVFPEGEKIIVGSFGFGGVAL